MNEGSVGFVERSCGITWYCVAPPGELKTCVFSPGELETEVTFGAWLPPSLLPSSPLLASPLSFSLSLSLSLFLPPPLLLPSSSSPPLLSLTHRPRPRGDCSHCAPFSRHPQRPLSQKHADLESGCGSGGSRVRVGWGVVGGVGWGRSG